MRISTYIVPLLAIATLAHAQPAAPAAAAPAKPEAPELPTDPTVIRNDSSFVFGYQLGHVFHQQLGSKGITGEDVEMASFIMGFEKALSKGELTEAEQKKLGASLQAFDKILQERLTKESSANIEAGKKFLEQNKKEEGVTTTASGLQYKIIKEGKGAKYQGDGTDNPEFKVHYEGRFVDGKKFDGNMGAPEPATFSLKVIPGFAEALKMMPTGSTWRLFIPSELAYGEKGAGGTIPPGSTLIFDLELLEIAKGEAPALPPGFSPKKP